MRGAISISALLCACGQDGAIEIVVEMDPQIAVDKVQLHVGLGYAQNTEGTAELLVPRDYAYPERPRGFYWKRDRKGARDVVDVDPGADDVRFVFHEGTHDRMAAIVVGLQGETIVAATALEDAYLDAGSVRQYHVKLKPASAAFPRPTRLAISVHRWGAPGSPDECAYLEDASDLRDPKGIYIVDHDDRDCDGLIENECRPDVYNGFTRPRTETTRCLRTDVLPKPTNDAVTCVLGGPACTDGHGTRPCEPSTVCAQPLHCVACRDNPEPLDCMAKASVATNGATRIECTFFVEQTASGPKLCGGAAQLAPRFELESGCDPSQPFWLWSTETGKWNPLTLAGGGLTFTATKPTAACDFALSASGTPLSSTPSPLRSIVTVPLANGRSAALPLAVSLAVTQSCLDGQSESSCVPAGDDMPAALAACLTSAVVDPW